MRIETLTLGPLETNCYIVSAAEGADAAVIDPAADAQEILRAAEAAKLRIVSILLTHGHFDHIGGVAELRRLTGAPVGIHPADARMLEDARVCGAELFDVAYEPSKAEFAIEDGQTLTVGALELRALHTPGHTPGGLSFFAPGGADSPGAVFTGDALFQSGVGRTDLPGGDGRTLLRSIREKLLTLPDGTEVFPGHGPETTIERERRKNPFLAEGLEWRRF